jgi:tripartite-type tricarboxylate transporter receptor subunit TctC
MPEPVAARDARVAASVAGADTHSSYRRPRVRALLAVVLLLSAIGSWPAAAAGSGVYPARPGRLVVPFGTGASTDIVARIYAQKFSEAWGQPLIVENRPGSGGVVGTEVAARATPDGYTMLVYGINQTITPWMYKKLPFDNLRDFAMISLYCTMPNVLVVHPTVAARNVDEFVAVVRASPGKLRYVSSGIGASPHLTMELLKSIRKLDILHVPYKVASQGYVDLLAGQLHAMFANLPGALTYSKAGRLRLLAVTSARRAVQLPDVPTMIESGIPDFEVTVWQGIVVPAATPQRIVEQIHATMMQVLQAPDLQRRFVDQGVTAAPTSRSAFLAYINQERTRWRKVVKDANVTAD